MAGEKPEPIEALRSSQLAGACLATRAAVDKQQELFRAFDSVNTKLYR